MQVHTPTRPLASFLSQLHTHHTLILEIIHINDPRSNENYYLNKTTTSNCFESSLLGQRQSIMDSSKSSLTLHGEEMMEAMRRQQELVMQLRSLVLPLLLHGAVHADTTSAADIAAPLFDDVIACNITVSSKLHQWCLMSSGGGAGAGNMVDDDDELVDDKSLVRKSDSTSKQHLLLHSSGDRTEKQAANKPSVGQKRSGENMGRRTSMGGNILGTTTDVPTDQKGTA